MVNSYNFLKLKYYFKRFPNFRLVYLFLSVVIVLFVFMIATISIEKGLESKIRGLRMTHGFQLEIKDLEVSLFSSTISSIVLKSKKARLSLGNIRVGYNPFAILFFSAISKVEIESLVVASEFLNPVILNREHLAIEFNKIKFKFDGKSGRGHYQKAVYRGITILADGEIKFEVPGSDASKGIKISIVDPNSKIQFEQKSESHHVINGKLADHVLQNIDVISELFPSNKKRFLGFNFEINRSDVLAIFRGRINLNYFSIHHSILHQDPVGPLNGKIVFNSSLDLEKKVFTLNSAKLALKNPKVGMKYIPFYLNGFARKSPPFGDEVVLSISLPETPCDSFLKLAPQDTMPMMSGFIGRGTVLGDGVLSFYTAKPEDFIFNLGKKEFSCRLHPQNQMVSEWKLNSENPVTKSDSQGSAANSFEVSRFISLANLPRHVVSPFLISEDISFYSHEGFDFESMSEALRKNLKEGKIKSGGSTISMQTAKNLFLNGERNLTRKLQEALLTLHLESVLEKDRILEIYLSLIEFGPGVYGIEHAANHFFAKDAANLSLLEATYLASLLPSPKKRYINFCRGHLSDSYQKKLHDQLDLMLKFDKISTDQHMASLSSELIFSDQNRLHNPQCSSVYTQRTPGGEVSQDEDSSEESSSF